jgi:hypothetical protein
MERKSLAIRVGLGVFALMLLVVPVWGQKKIDRYAGPNRDLERLLMKERGIKVTMIGPIYAGPTPPKGTKAQYSGKFKRKGRDWEIWRYARPGLGDILEVGWRDSNMKFRQSGSVQCGRKGGITENDVRNLLPSERQGRPIRRRIFRR